MKVEECMSSQLCMVRPDDKVEKAAALMAESNAGSVLVGDEERLVGILTDRDIAVRVIGEGRGPDCVVGEVMSGNIKYCFQDEELDHVIRNMGDVQVRRLPVVNRHKRLVGVVSIGDLAATMDKSLAGRFMGVLAKRPAAAM